MKTNTALPSLRDLPSEASKSKDLPAQGDPQSTPPAEDPAGEGRRAELRRRYLTPFVSAIPYHRWGLNE